MSSSVNSAAVHIPKPVGTQASRRRTLWQRIAQNKALSIGCSLLLLIIVIAIFAPFFSPFDPYVQDLAYRTVPPVWF